MHPFSIAKKGGKGGRKEGGRGEGGREQRGSKDRADREGAGNEEVSREEVSREGGSREGAERERFFGCLLSEPLPLFPSLSLQSSHMVPTTPTITRT